MKFIIPLIILLLPVFAFSQVALNTDSSLADNSAMLDVKSFSKGILIPRLSVAQKLSVQSPATSLLIFQTDGVPGFYFNAGTSSNPVWSMLATAESSWSLSGNSGNENNFIGTLDTGSLRFRLNNIPSGLLDPVRQNIAFGGTTLNSISTGRNNIAIGWGALNHNADGSNMVAIGDSALYNQLPSFAYYNTAVGSRALYSNTTGFENTAFGFTSLLSNTTGAENTATGDGSLRFNITGQDNTATGYHALYGNLSGTFNSAVGAKALQTNVSGNSNTALGVLADVVATDLSNATAIGYNAKVDASDKVRIGNIAVTSIGGQVGWTTFSDGRFKSDVHEDVPGLIFINKLRAITYVVDKDGLDTYYNAADSFHESLRTDQVRQTGFIAQEVEEVAKSVGYYFSGVDKPSNKTALYGLRYAEFVVPLVKGMQEQQQIIAQQKMLIEDLMQRVKKLEGLVR